MIRCICIDCEKESKFSNRDEARNEKWYLFGINMNDNEFYAVCPNCDSTVIDNSKKNKTVTTAKPEQKIVNSSVISYD